MTLPSGPTTLYESVQMTPPQLQYSRVVCGKNRGLNFSWFPTERFLLCIAEPRSLQFPSKIAGCTFDTKTACPVTGNHTIFSRPSRSTRHPPQVPLAVPLAGKKSQLALFLFPEGFTKQALINTTVKEKEGVSVDCGVY